MAVIHSSIAKAAKSLERVRKHRRMKKFKEKYENAVYFEMQKRTTYDEEQNCDSPIENIPNCDGSNNNNFYFKNNLKLWAVKHRITKMALNDLLSILITAGFCFLPKDSRTFMNTPSHVDIHKLSKGQMWYRGITDNLKQIFRIIDGDISVYLDFNFDGVPLFNSSSKCFWPIIVSIRGERKLLQNVIHNSLIYLNDRIKNFD